MKEIDGLVRIKKYTDDDGNLICGDCDYDINCYGVLKNKGDVLRPYTNCPVWHGERKSEKAYVCIHCEAVYLEDPVTQCDCLKGSGADFVEGVLIYTLPSPPQEDKP